MTSFKQYVRRHASEKDKAMWGELPSVESWGEVRMLLRQGGMEDHDLVRVRALWRAFKKSEDLSKPRRAKKGRR